MLKNWMGIFFYIGRASGQVWGVKIAAKATVVDHL